MFNEAKASRVHTLRCMDHQQVDGNSICTKHRFESDSYISDATFVFS